MGAGALLPRSFVVADYDTNGIKFYRLTNNPAYKDKILISDTPRIQAIDDLPILATSSLSEENPNTAHILTGTA